MVIEIKFKKQMRNFNDKDLLKLTKSNTSAYLINDLFSSFPHSLCISVSAYDFWWTEMLFSSLFNKKDNMKQKIWVSLRLNLENQIKTAWGLHLIFHGSDY